MKLWKLEPLSDWKPWYDTMAGIVVRADTEEDARAIAQEYSGDENRQYPRPWLDSEVTSCVELTVEGEAEMILRSFVSA